VTLSIQVKDWSDIPDRMKRKWLELKYQSLYHLFIDLMIQYKPLIDASPEILADIYAKIDWAFLSTSTQPAFTRYGDYYFGEPMLKYATAYEFQMIDTHLQKFMKTKDEYHMRVLFFTVARKRDKEHHIKTGDIRRKIISETEIEILAKSSMKIPRYILIATLHYVQNNLATVTGMYSKILRSRSGGGDGLGWMSTFIGIAESGVFGNIDMVYETNIHTLFSYLIKKQHEYDEIESQSKKR
jgi:hypothetical protein